MVFDKSAGQRVAANFFDFYALEKPRPLALLLHRRGFLPIICF